ncbi:YggS family pyridoxal phosphate-dependent enzyme [Haloflavibacter putidus]|uniref:Pyridoxal phosphate homeostasis protein n=1 Tax=Haloflavibacter putidus TaxID=2576776 RepID=A0A507ZX70_9FLAO|nr:YggS family pyridoxal phosphate-dependent enzyme [Haloflavibacter putidus]TQD39365.1 YggS family pyridoxal phosphate-dependent enzyme [Haloflavibacter putidus]
MTSIAKNIKQLKESLPQEVQLVAISKTKPVTDIQKAYDAGQHIFGENKIQEMTEKWEKLPKDIEWHMVGHVQSNKVKYMAAYVSLVHAVHKLKLLKEINKRAKNEERTIKCLLQIKIAKEDSKYGMTTEQALEILKSETYQKMKNVQIVGLMGMATFTENEEQVNEEFAFLKTTFDKFSETYPELEILSMGMSGDYQIAVKNGSNMVRIGSAIFGERNYN